LIPLVSGTADGIGLREGDLIPVSIDVSIATGICDPTVLGFDKGGGLRLEAGEFSTGVELEVEFSTGASEGD
jgi:hypothetical protein